MTHRERFLDIFRYKPVDYIPVYYFGTWSETKERWLAEGFAGEAKIGDNIGPQLEGMGPDWEDDIWNGHGLLNLYPIGNVEAKELSRGDDYRIYQNSLGAVIQEMLSSRSISHTMTPALLPDRESWEKFKTFLNPQDSRRFPRDLEERAVRFNAMDRPGFFMGGSLYGYLRDWMGVEAISCLMYDDPELLEEMTAYMADYFMQVYEPVLDFVKFDVCYIFEDCCGANGPLFSPEHYYRFFHSQYQRLFSFYRARGVEFIMLDSDGLVDKLIPCWLDSGVDIIFPLEIGVWNTDVPGLREKYGPKLRMFGGVDKHCISTGGRKLEDHLARLRDTVRQGGFIPIPDHRIPPECSYQKFLEYIDCFNRVFNS
jgi:uroporphyrinogen decarboxylase